MIRRATLALAAMACADPPPAGGDGSTGGTDDTTTVTPSTSSTTPTPTPMTTSTSETGSTDDTTTTGPACLDTEDCPNNAPFCIAGACVPCSEAPDPDDTCADANLDLPVCVDDVCVACREGDDAACVGATPICDPATNTCVPCSFHAQCPGACDIDDGSCIDDAVSIYVDNSVACPGLGDEDDPYCRIEGAIDAVLDGNQGILRIAPGAGQYAEDLLIGAGKTIAMLPWNGEPLLTNAGTGAPTLQVRVNATSAYVEGMRFQNNADDFAVDVAGGVLVLDRTSIVRNTAGALRVDGSGAFVTIRNGFVGATLASDVAVDAVQGELSAVYTTFVGQSDAAVACAPDIDVVLRNSLVVGAYNCALSDVSNTAAETKLAGVNNLSLGAFVDGWFVDADNGDFHLAAIPTDAESHAVWELGDPPTDIDGDARPNRDGAEDAVGGDK